MNKFKLASAVTALVLSTSVNAALINFSYYDNNPSLDTVDPYTGGNNLLSSQITNWSLLYEDSDGTGSLSINASGSYGNIEIANASITTNTNGSLHLNGAINFLNSGSSGSFFGDMAVTYNYDENSDVTVFGFSAIDFVGTGYNGLLMQDGPFAGYLLDFHVTSSALAYEENPFPVYSPVPVPAAVWLFGSGLVGLIGFVRRKKA